MYIINNNNNNPASHLEKKAFQLIGIKTILKPARKKISFLVFLTVSGDKGLKSISPRTSKALNTLEPKTLLTAKKDKPCIEDKAETAHSGAEVPIPNNTTPIKKGDT